MLETVIGGWPDPAETGVGPGGDVREPVWSPFPDFDYLDCISLSICFSYLLNSISLAPGTSFQGFRPCRTSNAFLSLVALLLTLSRAAVQQTIPDPEPTDTAYGGDAAARIPPAPTNGAWAIGEPYRQRPFGGETLANVIYFDFDSSESARQDQDTVVGGTRCSSPLNGRASRVRLEGMPMSAARANTTSASASAARRRSVRLLLIQGVGCVADSRRSAFGEERPDAVGSSTKAIMRRTGASRSSTPTDRGAILTSTESPAGRCRSLCSRRLLRCCSRPPRTRC